MGANVTRGAHPVLDSQAGLPRHPHCGLLARWQQGGAVPPVQVSAAMCSLRTFHLLTHRKLRTMNNHNKADGFERRLEVRFLVPGQLPFSRMGPILTPRISSFTSWRTSNMRSTSRGVCHPTTQCVPCARRLTLTASSYVYYTQIMQAETLASAYRLWRRNWKGKGREYTAGALVWQVRLSREHSAGRGALTFPTRRSTTAGR